MTSQAPTSKGPTDAGLTARVLSIHRASRTKPTPVRLAFFDYALETFSPVKAVSGVSNNRWKLTAYNHSICRVPLLPSLQIGGRLMSRVAASAPIQRKRH
jgi:hypothetical protein